MLIDLTKVSRTILGLACVVAIGGCGGGDSGTAPAPAPAPAVTSYSNFKEIGLAPQALPVGENLARAYGDFAGNGRADLFRAVQTYNPAMPQSQATASRFEFYSRQADGTFQLNSGLLASADGCIHPRKALVADFNGDGKPDVFVACHGYDASPFPGEKNKIVLSQPGGKYSISDASADIGFHHGAAATDVNGDGKVDVIVVNNNDVERAYVLLNDGSGRFSREAAGRLPTIIRGGGYFSVELADVNEDGLPDLLLGGHEWEATPTRIFLNPGSYNFSGVTPAVIPTVANEGVVLDFTLTGKGASRTLWVLRTSGGDGTFYQSRVVQKVSYPTLSSSVVLNTRPAVWVPWLIPTTIAGVAVVTTDNAAEGVSLPQ